MKEVRVFAPATVSNVGPGFDLMGFAIDQPGDILRIRTNDLGKIRIINKCDISLPEDPEHNVAGVALLSLLGKMESNAGYDIIFEEKINPGSGIGSSAASSTAAVVGLNELLGNPLSKIDLIPHALDGEFVASKSLHADNIAPAMLGGIVLIRSYDPFDLIELKAPENLWCTLVHPEIEIKTAESRKLIPKKINLKDALAQSGNLACLIAGLTTSNYSLIARSLDDRIAEPVRKNGIPGYSILKDKLKEEGILGMNISGSGPSLFALSDSYETAKKAEAVMKEEFKSLNIGCKTYLSRISEKGTRII
ncbi:MAG: homoserine kinase [Bacteroidales bacterium]